VGHDPHVAVGHRARQGDGQAGGGVPVEVHLDDVLAGRQVHCGAGAVEDLQRLVVAAPLDVLGEEQLAGLRLGWGSRKQKGRQQGQRREQPPDGGSRAAEVPTEKPGGMGDRGHDASWVGSIVVVKN